MHSIQDLQSRVAIRQRAARHLLAEKGARAWSNEDQAAFDALLDDAERAQALLDVHRAAARSSIALWAEERAALDIFIRKPARAHSKDDTARIRNAMSTTTPSQGGYAVGALVAGDLVNLVKGYGWMRQVARQFTTTMGSNMTYPSSDGTAESGEILAQNASATNADMNFGSVPMNTYKFGSKVFTVPNELIQDSAVDIIAEVGQRAVERIGRIQNAKFTTGTGTGEPTGLVTAAVVGKLGNTGQTTTILYDDLVDLADSVDEGHLGMPSSQVGLQRPTPGWMMSQAMRKVVRKLKDTNGRPIWTPAVGGELPQLLDYAVYMNNDMPAPAANAKSLAFGNLASYAVRDVAEFVLLRLEDSAFALAGQTGFLGWMRAGGNLLDSGAVKLYQHSAT